MTTMSLATGTRNSPTVSSIWTMVPEENPCMTTTLKHLESHQSPTRANISSGHTTAPTMQAIVVDCVAVVNPQFAPIIGDDLEVVTARPENSQAASPTNSEVVASGKARPSTTSVFIVHHMSPTSHVRSTTIKVRTTSTLTKIKSIFPKEASTIGGTIDDMASTTGTCNSPTVARVGAMIPEKHPRMATTLEHLKSHNMPPTTNLPPGHSTAPAVQAIIVDCVSIVDPQLASIVGNKLEMVTATPEKSHAACPTHSEVITSVETRPLAAGVAIVHDVLPAGHIRLAAVQVLATAALIEVESILPEKTMAICDRIGPVTSATCADNNPSVSSVGTMIPEEQPSMTTTLEELQSHKAPPTTNIPSGNSTTPTMQAIVVNCISIVDPELASIIGY
jgi:hypothetical protein